MEKKLYREMKRDTYGKEIYTERKLHKKKQKYMRKEYKMEREGVKLYLIRPGEH